MTSIYIAIPDSTTTAHGFGVEARSGVRVTANTPGAEKLPLWLRNGERAPRVGETVDTFRDGRTLYARGVQL